MTKPQKEKKPPTPKTKEPWARPPPPFRGDSEIDTTYLAVGRALSHWERLEAVLALIFAELVRVDSFQNMAVRRAYGSVLSFSGRAAMIEAAGEALFFERPNTELHGLLKELMNFAGGYSGRRNEIAHGVVGLHPSYHATPWQEADKLAGHVLLPSEYATNKRKLASGGLITPTQQTPLYYYSSHEIDVFAVSFRAIRIMATHNLTSLKTFLGSAS